MNAMKEMPLWVEFIFQEICDEIEVNAFAEMQGQHFSPSDAGNGLKIDVIEMAPVKQMPEFEVDMDEPGYGVIRNLDLRAAQRVFTEVTELGFRSDSYGRSHIFIRGDFEGHKVAVLIYTSPSE